MKDLITSIGTVFILSLFILQFSANQVTHSRLISADIAIENFRDRVKTEGYVSEDNSAKLVSQLSKICGCSEGDIEVRGSKSRQSKGEPIEYYIKFPIGNLIAAAKVLGISKEENGFFRVEENWVISRYEDPEAEKDAAEEEKDQPSDEDMDAAGEDAAGEDAVEGDDVGEGAVEEDQD